MSDSKNRAGSSKRRHARVIKVAPVTRAIRSVLAISATTLALGASGGALAGTLAIPATTAIHHSVARHDVLPPVIDLTVVHEAFAPSSVHASDAWPHATDPSGIQPDAAAQTSTLASSGDVADLTLVAASSPGPGGVSGSDDSIGFYFQGTGTWGFQAWANTVTSTTGIADGVFFSADNVWMGYTTADISATGYTWAAGIEVESPGYINDVSNDNVITASASGMFGQSWGIYAAAGGNASIANNGTINVSASGEYGTATGLYAESSYGDATALNTGTISTSASGTYGNTVGMETVAYGATSARNDGSITANATGTFGAATGMLAYSAVGNAYLENSSAITVNSVYGNAIGMYGYSSSGNVEVENSGSINATSTSGLADGIFASGLEVEVGNSGGITATGYTWAAGIEAQGTDSTSVQNSGTITAQATGYYGEAFGIYATGGTGGVSVTNNGGIYAVGNYVAGIQVVSDGDVSITNAGAIAAGDGYGFLATGIYATTNSAGADVTVVNTGLVAASSIYGSFGINVSSLVASSSVSVSNSGSIYASASSNRGYGATGILATGQENASIGNTGVIRATTNGTAYGAMALAFNGDAGVVNSGTISAYGHDAFGVVASSSNGSASVDNSGQVTAIGSYYGQGLVANGVAGATISNSGTVYARATLAYGAFADSGNGLAQITNDAGGALIATGYFGIGAIGISVYGDVSIDNAGESRGNGFAEGVGTFASSAYGDVSSMNMNTGTAYGSGYNGPGIGMFARATHGDASIVNAGMAVGVSRFGDGTGIRGTGATTEVTNYGLAVGATRYGAHAIGIYAFGSDSVTIYNANQAIGVNKYAGGGHAYGVYALSSGDISITSGGDSVMAGAAQFGYATGLLAYSFGGSVSVDNAGAIYAQGRYDANGAFVGAQGAGDVSLTSSGEVVVQSKYANAIGISGYSETGTLDLSNSGTVEVNASHGVAIGMSGFSAGGSSNISNSGDITTYSHDATAVGLASSTGSGDATADNSGSIYAGSYYGSAFGISGYSQSGSVGLTNSGSIETYAFDGNSIGMYGYASAGDVNIHNTVDGTISAYSYYGLADGIFASGTTVEVTNDGSIYANGYHFAAGIEAQGSDQASVTNTADISVVAYYGSHGYGVFSTGGAGGATITNDGTIAVVGTYATGIYAGGNGLVSVANTGGITAGSAAYVSDNYFATGIRAATNYDGASIVVTNSGDITANGYYGANGIDVSALGQGSSASITSSGSIYAQQGNKYGYGAIGVIASADADSSINNSGSITTVSAGSSYGAMALAFNGNASVTNSGDINATSTAMKYYGAMGIVSSSANGAAYADNSGTLVASAPKYGTGIQVVGNTGAVATNSGSISVDAGMYAYGIFATAGQGDVLVDNQAGGTVYVTSGYGIALGVFGSSTAGDVVVQNGGVVDVAGYGAAYGVYAVTGAGSVTVDSIGGIRSYTPAIATGILAFAQGGDATVNNSGSLDAISLGDRAYGVFAQSSDGNVAVSNDGSIYANAYGQAIAITATAAYGNVIVNSSGDTVAVANYSNAFAVVANGIDVAVNNSGNVSATGYYIALGIDVVASGLANATNSGSIVATAASYGGSAEAMHVTGATTQVVNGLGGVVAAYATSPTGIATGISAFANGDVSVDNDGSVIVEGDRQAEGIYAYGENVTLTGSGSIQATSTGQAFGAFAYASGNANVNNGGSIYAVSAARNAYGALLVGDTGVATNSGSISAVAYGSASGVMLETYSGSSLVNTGTGSIAATSQYDSYGVYASATMGAALVDNAGSIHALNTTAGGLAIGVSVSGNSGARVTNSGLIDAESATGSDTFGVFATAYGNVLVANSGSIHATDDDYAVGVNMDSAAGIATLVNSGTIQTYSVSEGEIAVRGGDGVQQIANYGDIYGAIVTAGGDDTLFNGQAGVWHVTNHSTDFGAGEDAITNGTGGRIVVFNSAIHTGADDDAIVNGAGATILLGNGGAIHLDASGDAGNTFVNEGRIAVQGNGLIDMGYSVALAAAPNPLPLTNNGLLDLVDGTINDTLTVAGDLAGNGSLDIDINPVASTADQLYVQGNVSGSQSVDINLVGAGLSGHVDPIQFAHVSGDSSADAFIGGRVIGYDESSFLDMEVNVISQIDTSNATADVFSVGMDVLGLNSAGSLGATVATVAHGVMASQIGTWRQRVGVIAPKRDDQVGLSPWIRVFGDSGSVKLAHHESNFGSGGTFGFDQSNNGREIGMNVNIRSDLNIGLLAAKTTGTQHLTGAGVGSDHLDSTAFGMYATWIAPQFYLDASYRWLDFDAHLRSAGGQQGTRGNGGAFNVEAGYTAWTFAGIAVTPQAQYTRSHVGDFSPIRGTGIDFVPNGGASTRGRLGVEFSKVMEGAGWVWTPYGSVNAIREFDGEANYTVGDNFTGFTSAKGTSAMVELGVGARKDGFSVTGGANWMDGGAYQGVLGGQVVVRYSW